MAKKVNPAFGNFHPMPSVNVFQLKEGGYMFYGWGAEPKKFSSVLEMLVHIEEYFYGHKDD